MTRSGPSLDPLADLDTLFRPFEDARGIVLAVSGGPDSTAMMALTSRWRRERKAPPVWIATVDHDLRAGSAAEAARVAASAQALGFPSRVLVWTGPKPLRAVQEKARAARYALLDSFAAEVGASHLATAHTLDDQAETLLFRMARGSGLAGLGGMRPRVTRGAIVHVRPLLAVRKEVLVDFCVKQGFAFACDPSNADPRFARTRWRQFSGALAAEGLSPERLGVLADRLDRADTALRDVAERAAAACTEGGEIDIRRFRADALILHPQDVVIRVLDSALADLGEGSPIRLNRLETLVACILDSRRRGVALRRTLHHCLIGLDIDGILTIRPEGPRRRGSSQPIVHVRSP